MTTKAKKRIGLSISIILLAYVLIGLILAFVMVNFFIKKPSAGWEDPITDVKGSRAPYVEQIKQSIAWLDSNNPEQVQIKSFDGLTLNARLLISENDSAKGTVLFMHGYHSRAAFEFAGFYEFFYNQGYNILLCDQRAHGNSEGVYLTFGVKERYDCRDWINFLNERMGNETPVWLCGVSMGCSTVLMTLGFDLPKNVKGVIADCGFTSPEAIVADVLKKDYHLPPSLFMPFINLGISVAANYRLDEYSTLEALKNNTIPVMFIHGNNDDFVPFEMGKENFEACTAKKVFLETKAHHAENFLFDTERYENTLIDFMQ